MKMEVREEREVGEELEILDHLVRQKQGNREELEVGEKLEVKQEKEVGEENSWWFERS